MDRATMRRQGLTEFLSTNEQFVRDALLFGQANPEMGTNDAFLLFLAKREISLEIEIKEGN